MIAQDPAELFDVYHADGSPAGYRKPRAAVHRDGDWHRAVHVWVMGQTDEGEGFLVVQRRGYEKDTWPGSLDVTVGGHYGAGETVVEALRETEEEIGVRVELSQLIPLGIRIAVGERPEEGIFDHELQDVFLYRDDRPLPAYRPNPAESGRVGRVDPGTAGRSHSAAPGRAQDGGGALGRGGRRDGAGDDDPGRGFRLDAGPVFPQGGDPGAAGAAGRRRPHHLASCQAPGWCGVARAKGFERHGEAGRPGEARVAWT